MGEYLDTVGGVQPSFVEGGMASVVANPYLCDLVASVKGITSRWSAW